ncbi:hypothetical protein V6N13_086104 [Hibiscus sabdariffa]|uniref:Uncharacterized protein n=1 Tax=Hibiscus sabdariffa TaxID=183260 RepID=A0ABR2FSP9_9ROSI
MDRGKNRANLKDIIRENALPYLPAKSLFRCLGGRTGYKAYYICNPVTEFLVRFAFLIVESCPPKSGIHVNGTIVYVYWKTVETRMEAGIISAPH